MIKEQINWEPSSKPTTRRNFTTLITFNGTRKPQYVGRCKLELDLLSQVLKIFPKNERFNDITAMFNWKFIQSKNILFIFATLELQDFVLVFKNEEICIKVFNGIFKNRNTDFVEEELVKERFLNLLFKNATKNWRLKEILEEWIQKLDEKEKNEYFKLLKWHQTNPELGDDEQDIKDVKMETNQKPMGRKRKHCEVETYKNDLSTVQFPSVSFNEPQSLNNLETIQTASITQTSVDKCTKVINGSMFTIVNCKRKVMISRKLLIFTSSDKTHCYEYNFYSKKQLFYHRCNRNVKGINAIFDTDENGKEFLKMEDKKHRCSPILYEPEKYIELKIVKKPDYEILENCATQTRRMLIIFDSNDRNQCYEYYWSSREKIFICCGCALKKRQYITAEIIHENTEIEYVILFNEDHVCETRIHNPEKYFSSHQFVTSPNFEIQRKFNNGIETKTLIIFDENDRKFCYAYHKNGKRFYCSGCCRKKTHVFAKIYKNAENEEYVILSNAKHVCSPQIYIPQTEIVILRTPKIKFIEAIEKFKSKLFIFDSTDPTLCYVFSQKGSQKRYQCLGCAAVAEQKNKGHSKNKVFYAYLEKDDGPNGGHYVRINGGEKHICQPQKYEPEKYEMKILKPKNHYILFREKIRNDESVHLVIYHQDDKKLCYKYFCDKGRKSFRCTGCIKKKTIVSAKLYQDSFGNEFLTSNEKEHVCVPFKYSSVIKPNTVILEKSGIDYEQSKKIELHENQIIRLPNFELRRNRSGVPERRLIVFFDDERKLCYEYRYFQINANFICKKCNVSARIRIGKENNNEKFVVLSEIKHKCEPVKYAPEKNSIKFNETENGTSNFMVFNRDEENKLTKLVIFTSSTKEMCYEYSYSKKSKNFRCCRCTGLKKLVSVKLLSENGKEYVQSLRNEHVCTPKKFILEEFQPKIIPESDFKLCSNKNGKPNSKLLLFDSEKDGFVYEFSLKKNNYFICLQCKNKKNISVSAKLFEKENGEKFLEHSSTKHVCKSKKYVPEKIKLTSNFVIHYNDSGVPDSRLTVLNDKDKSLGYRYSFFKCQNLFFCLGCNSKKKVSSAKLKIDEDGNQSFEFGKNEHICTIKNLKNEKLYFSDFKFEENGNALITNDPSQKNRCFKFAYDEKVGTFCCSKCLEKKKKYITATICKENDEKDFVLLNVPHCCTSSVV